MRARARETETTQLSAASAAYSDLWTWLIDDYGICSMLDLGCEEGHAVEFFRERGLRAIGVAGTPQDDPDIHLHNFASGRWYPTMVGGPSWIDLVWASGFMERVDERYLRNLASVVDICDLVLMTHSDRDVTYWTGAMAVLGFRHDQDLTLSIRKLAKTSIDPHNQFVRSGLAFRRRK